jgi:uncharacterized GH25 family protein
MEIPDGKTRWGRMLLVAIALFIIPGAASFADDHVALSGRVMDAGGKPIEHATVIVYHAGVKKGYSTFCPSCYTDCGKRDITDASGEFTIKGLSPDLWFELLVVHDGYTPTFVKKVDPFKGPAEASIRIRARVNDPSRVVHGRVVDPHGTPLRDAVVEPMAILRVRDSEAIYGMPPGLEPVAVTNEKGEFEIAYAEPAIKMALLVEARAMAPKFVILPTGSESQTVTVSEGAVVRGRLVESGKPVAGAEIGLNPRKPGMGMVNLVMRGSFYSEIRIGTQEDGSFVITNVPAPEGWYLYGKMESIASRGATDTIACATTHDNQEVSVGDIRIVPAYHLRGKVVLSDGKQVSQSMRVTIYSQRTRDNQTALLSSDGHFEFQGLAPGKYSLFPSVKGYDLPKEEPEIEASIDGDVDNLAIVLDPVSPAKAVP